MLQRMFVRSSSDINAVNMAAEEGCQLRAEASVDKDKQQGGHLPTTSDIDAVIASCNGQEQSIDAGAEIVGLPSAELASPGGMAGSDDPPSPPAHASHGMASVQSSQLGSCGKEEQPSGSEVAGVSGDEGRCKPSGATATPQPGSAAADSEGEAGANARGRQRRNTSSRATSSSAQGAAGGPERSTSGRGLEHSTSGRGLERSTSGRGLERAVSGSSSSLERLASTGAQARPAGSALARQRSDVAAEAEGDMEPFK